jgi:hypothetical protein
MDFRANADRVRRIIWQWDPIGVADLAPDDEYDCLIGPVLARLRAGAGQVDIASFLHAELQGHFGMTPPFDGIDATAMRLVDWWGTSGQSQ